MNVILEKLEPISLQKHAVPQLVRLIREGIRRGDLETGMRLSEAELARQFEVSRQPVREAFILLSNEGLLEVRPQRGTFVRKISVKLVQEVRFVREAIEADIVKLAARQFDEAQVLGLRQQLAAQARCRDMDIDEFIALDDKFHHSLASGVSLSHAWSIVEGLKLQLDRVRYLSLRQFPTDAVLEQHSAIVSAIENRDGDAAERQMRQHLNTVTSDLEIIAKNNPEKFQI